MQKALTQEMIKSQKNVIDKKMSEGSEALEKAKGKAAEHMKDYETKMLSVSKMKEPVYPSKEIDELKSESDKIYSELIFSEEKSKSDLSRKIKDLEAKKEEYESVIEKINQNQKCQEKIDSLIKESKENVIVLSDIQQKYDTCKEFIEFKCNSLENKINELFETVKFQLFEKNRSNDEIREVCNMRFRGHKYEDLSASTKLVANMELVKAFQKHYNILVPIICDNAEKCTADIKTDAQTILMYVLEERCPKCGGKSGRRQENGNWTCSKCGHEWEKSLNISEEK